MAIPALTSLLESVRFRASPQHLIDNIELSLKCITAVADEICNDQGSKLVEENIRSMASDTEYYLESPVSDPYSSLFADGAVELAAEEICSLSTGLLVSLSPNFSNCQKELSHYQSCTVLNFDMIIGRYVRALVLSYKFERITLSGRKCIERRAFAREIFCHRQTAEHFVRVWLTVFSDDTVRDLLQRLMSPFIKLFPDKEIDKMSNEELCHCLSMSFKRHRYLVVIDNLQCHRVWDEITSSFPKNKRGSKVIFTTAIVTQEIVVDLTSIKLDASVDDKMFDHLVFGEISPRQELELIKLDILFCCQWSPIALIMIAKYLSTINPTVDNWEQLRQYLESSGFVIKTKFGDHSQIISAILELLEHLGSSNPNNTISHTTTFDQERRNKLEGSSHHQADEDNELIVSPVGLEDIVERLVSDLVQPSNLLEKLAIVGMAGIGKTTLAGRIFHDERVSNHFDVRAWVKVSPVYSKRDMLLQLLHCINQSRTTNYIYGGDDGYLEEMLHQSFNRHSRYLIVMDDMWSIKAWTELKRIISDGTTGSHVLITSRQRDEMEFLNCKSIYEMSLLSYNRSWDLMREKVFGKDPCPSDLVETGKHIAKSCKGLPLAIIVIAGVLLKIGKTLKDWQVLAESVRSVVISNQNHCQAIFSLSYRNLPHHLKSCFLYMGAFPVSSEIEARTLIRLWVAEGFVITKSKMSLEDVAEDYLNDLIGRSLLVAGKRRSNESVKTCHMHDLLQEFCIQEARKEKLMNVIKDCRQIHSKGSIDERHRFSFHCEIYDDIHLTPSQSRAGSALFFRECSSVVDDILLYYFDFKQLKVLDIISLRFDAFPVEQISKLLLLRHLAFTASFELPSIVFELRKLETLVVNGPWFRSYKIPVLPVEFYRCINLKHLQLRVATHLFPLGKPSHTSDLPHLLTLYKVTLSSCTSLKFAGIFSIIKLCVCETPEDNLVVGLWEIFFKDLVLFKRVRTLKLVCFGRNTRPLPMLSHHAFPQSLKKLTLCRSYLTWEAMTSLAELPSLEVLKLRNYAFQGPEWKTLEGGFQRLKYLLIEETDLEVWILEGFHFPQLRCLVIKYCKNLYELPNEVGDLGALTKIELHFCSVSAEKSAKHIQEEQCREYCHDIEVLIRSNRKMSNSSVHATNE